MDNHKVAEFITNRLFDLGGEPHSPCTRIQFVAGVYPNNERTQGGFCKSAMIDEIEKLLMEYENIESANACQDPLQNHESYIAEWRSMTNQEINLKIAEIEGIKAGIVNDKVYSLYRDGSHCGLLDYTNNWNLLGPLMLKLSKAKWSYHWDDQCDDWRWMKLIDRDNFEDVNQKHFGRATCLAYINELGDE